MPIKNDITDFETHRDKLYGIYRGVVECRYDPQRLCRVKVRVWGVHDEFKIKEEKKGIPTHELPWAEPAFGLFMGSVSGNGLWTVPLQGSYVWVFFENGNWMQPRYFASAPGNPIEPANPEEGFNDPMGEFPRGDWIDEPDTHRLMKKDKLAETTLLTKKVPGLDLGVDIAFSGTWDEHMPLYQAEYPFNTVLYSHSGIYMEIDDTEGNRRFHLYHPSNSYIEIGEIGQMIIKNTEKRWDVCEDMQFIHIMNDFHRKVDTNRTSLVMMDQWDEIYLNRYSKIHIDDRKDVLVDMVYHIFNDEKIYTDVNRTTFVGVDSKDWVDSNKERYIGADDKEVIVGNEETHTQGNKTYTVDGTWTDYSDGIRIIKCGDKIHIQSAVEIVLDAPKVTIKADEFLDHAAYTEIADDFVWNGVAQGMCEWSGIAWEAVTAGELGDVGEPDEMEVASEAPEAPEKPEVPEIEKPEVPYEIPNPPPPPLPPILEYIDEPPEEDPCPPMECPNKTSVIE